MSPSSWRRGRPCALRTRRPPRPWGWARGCDRWIRTDCRCWGRPCSSRGSIRGNDMSATFDDALFRKLPVVGILRFFKRAEVEKLVPASIAGGLRNIEVTMNSAGAEDLIRLTVDLVAGNGNV